MFAEREHGTVRIRNREGTSGGTNRGGQRVPYGSPFSSSIMMGLRQVRFATRRNMIAPFDWFTDSGYALSIWKTECLVRMQRGVEYSGKFAR